LRTGQARAEVPANAARTMAERPAAFAPDRWSETRVAGQTPMWVNWQPSKRWMVPALGPNEKGRLLAEPPLIIDWL